LSSRLPSGGDPEHGRAQIKRREVHLRMIEFKVPARANSGLKHSPPQISENFRSPCSVNPFPGVVENIVEPGCNIIAPAVLLVPAVDCLVHSYFSCAARTACCSSSFPISRPWLMIFPSSSTAGHLGSVRRRNTLTSVFFTISTSNP